MLYMMHMGNSPDITYQGGQDNIIHLEADLTSSIAWANTNFRRWVFTSSNAGSRYFQDTNNISNLSRLNWNAINAKYWNDVVEEKQSLMVVEAMKMETNIVAMQAGKIEAILVKEQQQVKSGELLIKLEEI